MSEENTKPPLLFETEITTNYHQKEILPDVLTEASINQNSSTVTDLILHSQQVVNFLQKNKIHGNPFYIDAGAFEHLFSVFASYYRNPSLTKEEVHQKLELVKIEQSIHCITDISAPQDISFYFDLIVECCEEESLCEIIMLLYRKVHTEKHTKWLQFLIPFMRYLADIKFEFSRILELDASNISALIMATLDKLKKIEMSFGIEDENFGDLVLLRAKVLGLKENFTKMNKDEGHYFYCLGLWAFAVHLLNLIKDKNYTFLRLCVSTSFYFDHMKKILGENNFTQQQQGKSFTENYEVLLLKLIAKGSSTTLFETLNCVLSLFCAKKVNDKIHVQRAINAFFVLPCNKVCANKEFLQKLRGSSFGSFASLFEHLLWGLLETANQLFKNLLIEDKLLKDLVVLRLLEIGELLNEKFAPIIVDKYYSTLEKYSKNNDLTIMSSFPKDYLQNILGDAYNPNVTSIQLKYIVACLKDLPNNDKTQLQILLKGVFESFLKKVQQQEGHHQICQLKEVGVFLMGVLTVKNFGFDNLRSEFLKVYLEFLMKKCKLELWDLMLLQESLWTNFSQIENFDEFCESHHQLLSNFLTYYQCQIGDAKRVLKRPMIFNKVKESAGFQKILWEFISRDISKTEETLTSGKVDQTQINRFIYFTLQWTDGLVMGFEPEKDSSCLAKLTSIHTLLLKIFFDPVLVILSRSPAEKKIINDYYSLILCSSQNSKWRATEALCEFLEKAVLKISAEIQKEDSCCECIPELILMIENRDHDKASRLSINIYSLMMGLNQLSSIFENVNICPYSQSEREILIPQYSRTLEALKDFILKISKTFGLHIKTNDLTHNQRSNITGFFRAFGQGLNTVIKPFNRIIPTNKKTIQFSCDLMGDFLKDNADLPYGFFIAMFYSLKDSFSEGLCKKIINILLYSDHIFSNLLERVRIIIQEACDSNLSKAATGMTREVLFEDIELVANFFCVFLVNLDLKLDKVKIQAFIGDYLKKTFEKLVENLFEVIIEKIGKFSFWKVTAINSNDVNRTLEYVVKIFHNCFVTVKANTESRILEEARALKRPDMKVLRHEREKFYANGTNDFASTRYVFVSEHSTFHKIDKENVPEEDDSKLNESMKNLKEIYEKNLQTSFQKIQSGLEKLKERYTGLDREFCENLGPFMLLITDPFCDKVDKKHLETGRKNSLDVLMRILQKFTSRFAKSESDYTESVREVDKLLEEEIDQALKVELTCCNSSVYNKINMLHGFLRTLKELLQKSTHELQITKSSIFCLHCCCKVLLSELLNQNFEKLEFAQSGLVKKEGLKFAVQSVIDNMTALLVTFYLCLLKKGEKSSDEALSVLKWVELVFTLYTHSEASWGSIYNQTILLSNLTNLMQIALCINPNSSINFLLKETSLISIFLDSKRYTPWNSKFLTSLTFIFSALLQDSVPDEIAISQEMKRIIGFSESQLNELDREIFVQRMLKKNPGALRAVLDKNFITFVSQSEANLQIKIDLEKQDKTPENEIEQILNYFDEDAKTFINILTDAVINNHIYNMSLVSDGPFTGYKETSTIVTLISALAFKYPHIAVYLGLNKKSCQYLANEGEEGMLTFLERLFRLSYFDIHPQDLVTMIKVFCSPLGVIFQIKSTLLSDISHVFIDNVLDLLGSKLLQETRKLEKNSSSVHESYISIHSIITSFTFLWSEIETNVSNEIFEELFRIKFLTLLKDILGVWRFIAQKYYPTLKNCGNLDSIMTKLLSCYFNSRLKLCSVDLASLVNHKNENYHDFLPKISFSPPKNGVELKKILNEVPSQSEKVNFKNYERIISEFGEFENQLIFPITSESRICKDQKISENLSQRLHVLEILLQGNTNKNLDSYLRKMNFCIDTSSQVKKDFSTAIKIKYSLISLPETSNENIMNTEEQQQQQFKTLTSLLHQNQIQKVENPTTILIQNNENNNEIIDKNNEEEKIDSKLDSEPKEIIIQKEKIKYFVISARKLHDVSILPIMENQIMLQLKFLSEQVLLSLAKSTVNSKNPEFRKKVTTEEVENYSKSLSSFDRNLLLCLLENFEILSGFEYPADFREIKAEYTWMKTNFSDYLRELNNSLFEIEEVSEGRSNPLTSYDPANLSSDIHFQSQNQSSAPIILPNTTFKTPTEKDVQLLEQLYLVDDALVEAFISFFFIEYEKGFANSNPQVIQMLQELCKSPVVETKLLDFCLLFIHRPDALIQEYIQQKSLLSEQILSLETAKKYDYKSIVASNIFDFLKHHLKTNEYLFYLPRRVLASQRLAAIASASLEKEFLNKTCSSVSVFDLLIASLPVYESTELKTIILDFFSKERSFNIIDVSQKSVAFFMQYKVLTTKSCQKLLQNLNADLILKNAPSIVLYDIDSVVLQIEKKIKEIMPVLDVANSFLHQKIKRGEIEVILADIEELSKKQSVFNSLEELISFVSYNLANRILNQRKKLSSQRENDQLCLNAMKAFEKQLFSQKNFKDFMINLFEFATYSLHKNLIQSNKTICLAASILKICVHFYMIIYAAEDAAASAFEKSSVGEQKSCCNPLLSKVVLDLPKEVFRELPDPIHSFKELRQSGEFDCQTLLADLCMKHPDTLFKVFSEDSSKKGFQKEISLIQDKILWVLDLTTKKRLLTNLIKTYYDQEGQQSNSTRQVQINRKELLDSSIGQFSNQPLNIIRQKVQISFLNEFGMDGGGLRREWYAILASELFDPKKGLFKLSKDNVTLQPSSIASMVPSHLKFFEFAGIIIAKAVTEDCIVDVNLSRPFIKHLLQKEIGLKDLADVEPELEKSLGWILKNPVETLEQQFTYETEFFESKFTEELLPSGYETLVTEANKELFVQRVCEARVRDEISEELAAFLRGFYLIIPSEFLQLFSVDELQALIGGARTINVQDMQKFASYSGWTKDCEQMKWFWKIMNEFSQEELGAFWFFTSGSPKPAYGGFKEKPLRISKNSCTSDRLPVARTCSTTIEMPAYESKQQMKQKLLCSIFDGQRSFMFA